VAPRLCRAIWASNVAPRPRTPDQAGHAAREACRRLETPIGQKQNAQGFPERPSNEPADKTREQGGSPSTKFEFLTLRRLVNGPPW